MVGASSMPSPCTAREQGHPRLLESHAEDSPSNLTTIMLMTADPEMTFSGARVCDVLLLMPRAATSSVAINRDLVVMRSRRRSSFAISCATAVAGCSITRLAKRSCLRTRSIKRRPSSKAPATRCSWKRFDRALVKRYAIACAKDESLAALVRATRWSAGVTVLAASIPLQSLTKNNARSSSASIARTLRVAASSRSHMD